MSRTTTESPPSGLPGPRPQRRARLGMRAGSVLLAGLTAIAVATGPTAAVSAGDRGHDAGSASHWGQRG